jgi:hypothetical protein
MAVTYIGQALPAKIVTTDGVTTLFHIAARELGDALQWWRIADLNGINDPWVPAGLLLKIPQPQASNNGGVPFS